MKDHLYELLWQVVTDSHGFLYREFRVFASDVKAKQYGKRRERELNNGVPIEERAQDGYYFQYHTVNKVTEIDGFKVTLA